MCTYKLKLNVIIVSRFETHKNYDVNERSDLMCDFMLMLSCDDDGNERCDEHVDDFL